MKFVVTIDRPFYPEVDYFDSLEKAIECRNEHLAQNEDGGENTVNVSIAIVIESNVINTTY